MYDYTAGKADWLAHGLPTEGERAAIPRAKDVLRRDAVVARPSDPVGPVAARVGSSPFDFALVATQDGVVLGRLPAAALTGDPAARADDAMESGPSTVRPDRSLEDLAKGLDGRGSSTALVTDPDGRLLGVATLADMRARLAGRE